MNGFIIVLSKRIQKQCWLNAPICCIFSQLFSNKINSNSNSATPYRNLFFSILAFGHENVFVSHPHSMQQSPFIREYYLSSQWKMVHSYAREILSLKYAREKKIDLNVEEEEEKILE